MAMLPRNMEINSAGFREIHRYFFQNVYDWARKDRTVDTGRPGAPFCKSAYIEAQLNKRFAAINAEGNLHGLDADQFAARAAEHINELNAIHPFLDGNGRVQRAFLEILAEQAGHEFDLGHIDPKAWNEASIQGFQKEDHSLMAEVIGGCILRD
jgi:cell filamentation protein